MYKIYKKYIIYDCQKKDKKIIWQIIICDIIYYFTWLKQSLQNDLNTKHHLAKTAGNGDPMREVCIPRWIPRTWEQQGWNSKKQQTQKYNIQKEYETWKRTIYLWIRYKNVYISIKYKHEGDKSSNIDIRCCYPTNKYWNESRFSALPANKRSVWRVSSISEVSLLHNFRLSGNCEQIFEVYACNLRYFLRIHSIFKYVIKLIIKFLFRFSWNFDQLF